MNQRADKNFIYLFETIKDILIWLSYVGKKATPLPKKYFDMMSSTVLLMYIADVMFPSDLCFIVRNRQNRYFSDAS